MRFTFITAFQLFGFSAFSAVTIGNESVVTVPTSAHFSAYINVRPGNGEVVSNNPPIISWFYGTNHLSVNGNPNGFVPHWADQTNAFRLRVFTNAAQSGTAVVDVNTPLNFYNFLAPLPTNATRQFWWKVDYITNGVTYFTSALYTFTLATGALDWDRSMLAETNYLATNGVHPLFLYRGGEEAAIETWMQTQGTEYGWLLAAANAATNSTWWTNPSPVWGTNSAPDPTYITPLPADLFTRVDQVGAVLNRWRFSGDNRWTNASMTGWLKTNLAHAAATYVHSSNNWWLIDYGQPAGTGFYPRLIAAIYDWMYDLLGTNVSTFDGQLRTNAAHGGRLTLRYITHNGLWEDASPPSGGRVLRYDGAYPRTNETAPNLPKIGGSHTTYDLHTVAMFAPVLQQDGAEGAFAFNWMMNYLLARGGYAGGFAAYHSGPYGYVINHLFQRNYLQALMIFDVAYPQAQLQRTAFAQGFPSWITRMMPYGMRKYHGAFGDGAPLGYAGSSFGDKRFGWDLAAVTRSGVAMQQYNINIGFSNAVTDASESHWDYLPLRYHYRTTPAPETNSTAALFAEDGYAIVSDKSSSEFDCYTNGVGGSLRASSRDPGTGHNNHADLSPDLWAYGSQVTDGGGMGLDAYGYAPEASDGLFVNGYGQGSYGGAPDSDVGTSTTVPVMSSFVAYTNNSHFSYACADGTAIFTNSFHPERGNVKKAKRHWFFNRDHRYWVFLDEFTATTNATFAFRWHVPWVTRYELSGSPLANETAFTGDRFGSNGYTRTADGFTYTGGRYDDANSVGPSLPRVPVHVSFVNDSSTYGLFSASGTNRLDVSTNAAIGSPFTNSTLNPYVSGGKTYATPNPDRAVGIWVTNRMPTNAWSLMTVIIPQQPGIAAPIITRNSDRSVTVTYDGVTETTYFGQSVPKSAAATYAINTVESPADEQSQAGNMRVGNIYIRGGLQ